MLAVGALSTIIDFGLFNVLLAFGTSAPLANAASMAIAMLGAYWTNLRWSYRDRGLAFSGVDLAKFIIINLTTAGLVQLGITAATASTSDPLVLNLVKAALTVAATVMRLVAYRRWVFSANDAEAASHDD